MPTTRPCLDVLCLGHASYDLVFSVPRHPGEDEKLFADHLLGCGGGPAANAAVCAARLGYRSAFAGYLGRDVYGDSHHAELERTGVATDLIVRGTSPTPLSVILVKPDGKRALLNYKGDTIVLPADAIDFSDVKTKTVLFDGHEPQLSLALLAKLGGAVPSVLDAGSLHAGTQALLDRVDYLVCSEKFALQYAGDEQTALYLLAALSPNVVVTLGERGLIWQRGAEKGALPAPPITAVDTTGAGDAFHGAFAAALAAQMAWPDILHFASAAGAFCCSQMGARPGLPNREQLQGLLSHWRKHTGC
ncbi:PfkB family carbohydrate kinase [Methylomonas sp. SURF-2]|uniref:PfkB family carbohydrate kinase n=1 Tax=Methylomonas subterranea TaxID=2952225 RepID=A0ABT1TJA0_9GAMM|nr:PfkB family carbohydrate kinase [Methylomonas sp. SURF-2]MCQ8105547.1 PfkB family carbohydrate kinase [Methylomonas sp. SURF-2]